MKKLFITLLFVFVACTLMAQDKEKREGLTFTTIVENKITPVKNQNRSGTCWDYATCAFFESEILRATGKSVDLAEMFVANKNYVDCADYHVRMHGCSRFSEGGSADDVLAVIQKHGICPENAMAAPGSLTGDSLANFTEFFSVLTPYVEAVAKGNQKTLSTQWRKGLQEILDAYLGVCPERFTFEGKQYTPRTFADALGIDWKNYVSITSFTHHPFYEPFVIEAPYKWRPRLSENVPLEKMMRIIDSALQSGYTVCWGGDVSDDGFTRQGLGIACDLKKVQDLTGSDAARWLKLSRDEKANRLKRLGADTPEVAVSQELRQQRFDNWQSTYDHVMLIFGIAKDQNGREYYMVKNSWGETGDYKGIWYMSKNYIALATTYIFLNRNAVHESLRAE